jgi:hypothetical protein
MRAISRRVTRILPDDFASIFKSLVAMPLAIAAVALNLYAGWSIMGIISLRRHWIATFVLLLLVLLGLLIFFVGVNALQGEANNDDAFKNGTINVGTGDLLPNLPSFIRRVCSSSYGTNVHDNSPGTAA